MEKGSVVLIEFPQSDGSYKSRPAVLLKEVDPYNDWLLCVVSTKIHNEIKGLDILLDVSHPDFRDTHLKMASLIRSAILYTIPTNFIKGKIGRADFSTTR